MPGDTGGRGSGPTDAAESLDPLTRDVALADAVADGLFQFDPAGRFVAVNDAFCDLVGRSREDLLGEPLSAAFPDDDATRLSAARRGLVGSTPETATASVSIRPASGEESPCEVRLRVVERPGDRSPHVAGSLRPVADRERIREELRQETEKFRSLVQGVEEYAIFTLDPGGHVTSWNEGAERIKGYGADEILGEHFSTFYTDEDVATGVPEENLNRAGETGTAKDEGWRVRADGSRFWANVVITPVYTEDGELRGYAKVIRDMTDRREREEQLRRERDLVAQILEANPVGIMVLDADAEIARLNDAGAEILGVSPDEMDGYGPTDWAVYDEDGEPVAPEKWPHSRTLRTGESVFDWRCAIERPDGTRRWVSANSVPLVGEDGSVERVILAANDISALKEQQAALRRERDFANRVLDASPAGIAVVDRTGSFTRINDTAGRTLGIGADEIDAYTAEDWTVHDEDGDPIPPEDQAHFQVMETGEPVFDWRIRVEGKDGVDRWLSVNVVPLFEDGEIDQVVIVGDDVTRLKEQTQLLARERDELAAELDEVFRRIDDAFYAVDESFRFTYVNERAEELLQHDEEDLLGRSVWEVFPETTETPAWESFHRSLETQEPTSHEVYFDPLDFWVETNVYPSETGLSVYFRDVTERVERERALEESRNRYQTLVENFPNGAVALVDENLRYVTVGGTPIEEADASVADLEGSAVEEILPPELAALLVPRYVDALDGESSAFEAEIGDRVHQFRILPVRTDDGDVFAALGTSQDITERIERERALEESEQRYRTLVENFPDGAVALFDEHLRYTAVGGRLLDQLGIDPKDAIGDFVAERYPDDLIERIESHFRAALDGEASTFEEELYGHFLHAHTLPISDADGEVFAGMLVVQDVTELREHERELRTQVRQQETVTELGQRALAERDLDALFDEVTECVAEVLDADYCKVLELLPGGEKVLLRSGVGWREGLVGSATVDTGLDSQAGYTLRTDEPVVVENLATETRFSGPELLTSHDVTSGISVVVGPPDDPWGVLGVHTTDARAFSAHDVNFVQSVGTILATAIERIERERELARFRRAVESAGHGIYMTDADGQITYVNPAFEELTGYPEDEVIGRDPSILQSGEHDDEYYRDLWETILAGEVWEEEIVDRRKSGERYYANQTISPVFDDGAIDRFVAVQKDVTERIERERELARQREELAALNRLNDVVQEITHATVESSSREEIERLVCARLADSKSYRFAWVGELDRGSGLVSARTEAGVEGYLDGVTIAVDSSPFSEGPTARAFQTKEAQITRDTEVDPNYEPWREHAREHGFRSSAAIPIVYEDVCYGVLNVYSERIGAFDGHERTILVRLGNVVGHAINALERKEALMNDQVVEVEFAIDDVASLVGRSVETAGTITFDRTVPVGDGVFLQYGTATQEAIELLETLVDALPYWEEVSILDDRFDEVAFEARLSEPPAISTVAAYSGRVRTAAIEDGDYRMSVELPPSADVRAIVEALRSTYPGVELLAQRRTTREDPSKLRIDDVVAERLTDRQRATLEAAYFGGYFDTPRKRSGEEVAASLGITAPTLHQHLRKGQRKLLAAVFDSREN